MFTRILAAALTAITLLGAHVPAYAATAYLITCNAATSATGRLFYVGTYDYAGATFTYTFDQYCPYSIEIR